MCVEQADEPIHVIELRRLEEEVVHDAENGGAGSDPDGQA